MKFVNAGLIAAGTLYACGEMKGFRSRWCRNHVHPH